MKRMVFHEITPEAIQRRHRRPPRPRPPAGRRPGGPPHPRPPLRLRGHPRPVEEGAARALGRAGAERRHPHRRRARAGAHALPAAAYWDLEAMFAGGDPDRPTFAATLVAVDGTRLATGKDFDEDGRAAAATSRVLDEAGAEQLADGARGRCRSPCARSSRKPYTPQPSPPFMTSTLQQEAGRKLRFGVRPHDAVAQRLYENGYITYMRTDSTTLSETALTAARSQILRALRRPTTCPTPRATTRRRSRTPRRPTRRSGPPATASGCPTRWRARSAPTSPALRADLEAHGRLADDRRPWASRSRSASGATASDGGTPSSPPAARPSPPRLPAGLRRGLRRPRGRRSRTRSGTCPPGRGRRVDTRELEAKGHETQPPARYTEASLVKPLEELGVGRPSTYASIIGTIQDRGYVWKKGSALVPSFTAFAVVTLLEQHFPDLVDYAFTARMEDDLDEIASGDEEQVPWLSRFYFGEGGKDGEDGDGHGLHQMVSDRLGEIDAREINTIPLGADPDGVAIVARVGRYGPVPPAGRGHGVASPTTSRPTSSPSARAVELLEAPKDDRVLGARPRDRPRRAGQGGPLRPLRPARRPRDRGGRRQAEDGLAVPDDDARHAHPRRGAAAAVAAPGVGADPPTARRSPRRTAATARTSRRATTAAAWPTRTSCSRSPSRSAWRCWPSPRRAGRQAAKPPLKELGDDPATERPMVLKDGRFGPYVTDGETQRLAAQGRHGREHHPRAGRRAAGRAPAEGSAQEEEARREEEAGGQEEAAAKKPAAKKPAATTPSD